MDYKLYFWGKYLFDTPEEYVSKPTRVKLIGQTRATSVAIGESQMLVINELGQVFSMGSGPSIGHEKQQSSVKMLVCHPVKLLCDEDVTKESSTKRTGEKNPRSKMKKSNSMRKISMKEISGKEMAVKVFCCENLSLAVNRAGSVYVWGQLDKNTEWKEPKLVKKIEKEMQVKSVLFSNKQFLITIDLHNTRFLKFFSFYPPIIQCGTLERLFDWIFDPLCNAEYLHAFLRTYRSFTTPSKFIEMLAKRCNKN